MIGKKKARDIFFKIMGFVELQKIPVCVTQAGNSGSKD